jgi:hypothetical protein
VAADPKKKNVKVVKKKISPYPIEGEMVHGAVKISLAIMRVSPRGMVAQVKAGMCLVGTHYQCQFYLPQSRFPVQVEGKVFKTYDRTTDLKNIKKIERITEVIFINLNDAEKAKVSSFMQTIGQKD